MILRISLMVSLVLCGLAAAVADDAPERPKPKVQIKKVPLQVKPVQIKAVQIQVDRKKQAEARKKLVEAQKAAADARQALAEATKALEAAEGEEAKQAAQKKLDEANEKLEQANREVAKARQDVRKFNVGAAVIRQGAYRPSAIAVRQQVDPQDAVERFALLLPGGPLVLEVSMTVDGQPFRAAREKLIDEMLAAADKDGDGKASWEEALNSNRFTLGRVRLVNDEQRKQYVQGLDANKNGLVDRDEARKFVAQYFGGPAFTLSSGSGFVGRFGGGAVVLAVNGQLVTRGGGRPDVRKLLDADEDGVLSEKEIAAAAEKLKSRDADDNDLLLPQEVNAGGAANNRAVRVLNGRVAPRPQLAVLLGPLAKADALLEALKQHYKNDDGEIAAAGFSAVPGLFKTLDKNADGKLQGGEVLALNDVEPHVALALDLSKSGDAKGMQLKSLAEEVKKSSASAEAVSVQLPGFKLSFTANLAPSRVVDYRQTAQSYMGRFDKDNNGYLDKDELAGNLARMMDLWDADEDGKVYAKEIIQTYTRMQAPQQSQVRARAADQGNSLWQTLDQSGDNRLSLREMRTAHEQIKSLDENKDGRVSPEEIPVAVTVSFGLGTAGFVRQPGGAAGRNRPAAQGDVPEWFSRMDRNGDGDLTLKEFLGDEEQFKKLDTNGDGFIEPKEARAAESK